MRLCKVPRGQIHPQNTLPNRAVMRITMRELRRARGKAWAANRVERKIKGSKSRKTFTG
jgi:hypothetical protein